MSKQWACVCRFGGIGDNLIAASVLAPLKRMGYRVEVLTEEPNHVLFQHNPHVDKLSVKKKGSLPTDHIQWQSWLRNRASEYAVFAHLSHSCEMRHALFRAQSAFWASADYRRKLCAGSYLETAHDIAGVPYEFGPLYYSSEEERQRAAEQKSKIGECCIGWVLSGSRMDKIYPYATMAIHRIIKELNLPVVMTGIGGKQYQMAKTIETEVERTNSSLDGLHLALSPDGTNPGDDLHWSIRRTLALLQQCDIVVTPDTGAAWAVAMEPMPKIMMLSHASAENISKHWANTTTLMADQQRVPCFPCHRLHDFDDPSTCIINQDGNGAACISDISVETIIENLRRLQSVLQAGKDPGNRQGGEHVVLPLRRGGRLQDLREQTGTV